jgi:5-methylcytosine-specific restriction endonuclease McrA
MASYSAIVSELQAAGVTGEALVAAIRRIEAAEDTRSPAAIRQARYRQRLGMPLAEWRVLREEVLKRDGHACQYCGSYGDTVNHVIPLAAGGKTVIANLVAACHPCNSSKRDRPVSEWEASRCP